MGALPEVPRCELRFHRDEWIIVQWYKHTDGELVRAFTRVEVDGERIARVKNYFFNSIRNGVYILERAAPGSDTARRALSIINRQTTHLARLVDDLLDVTRIARGKIELRRECIDLCDEVRRTLDDHRATFVEANVEVDATIPAAPLWIRADGTRVAQILGNLLVNASKFTPAAGRVVVVLAASDDVAKLLVRDTGVHRLPRVDRRVRRLQPCVDGRGQGRRRGRGRRPAEPDRARQSPRRQRRPASLGRRHPVHRRSRRCPGRRPDRLVARVDQRSAREPVRHR
jgi:hypothetical protein